MWSAHTEDEFTNLHVHSNICVFFFGGGGGGVHLILCNGTSSFKLLLVANMCLLRMMHVLLTHHNKAVCVGRMGEYAHAHCAVTEHRYSLIDAIRVYFFSPSIL